VTDDALNIEFGRRLRQLRDEVDMSQEALAKTSGLSRTSIVNIERGRQGVSLGTLYRLASAMGFEPQSLLPSATPPPPSPRIAIGPRTRDSERAVLAVIRRADQEALD
jgi:transcriptional regulator with XRE-family HTH domain